MKKSSVKVGMKVTCLAPVEAYYSGMKIAAPPWRTPIVVFSPGDGGTVACVDVPYVRGYGSFCCIDFKHEGRTERVALAYDNIKLL